MALQVAQSIAKSIQGFADSHAAVGKSKYFKHVCQFHGLKSADLKEAVRLHLPGLKELYSAEGKAPIHEICKTLISSKYHEEKLAAPMIMSLVLDKKPSRLSLDDLEFLGKEVFDAGHAYDWATVDTVCGSVIHNVLINEGNSSKSTASRMLLDWAKNPKGPTPLWKQRASCVAFVKLARHGAHTDIILDIADVCVRNNERFVQLGLGWMLRELWLAEPQRTVSFITDNYSLFSREGLRYSIEKMDSALKTKLLKYDASKGGPIIVAAPKPSSAPTTSKRAPKKRTLEDSEEYGSESESEEPVKKKKRN